MSELDPYDLADALYDVGYNDRKGERDYDPRGNDEWQKVVDAINKLTPVLSTPKGWKLVPEKATTQWILNIQRSGYRTSPMEVIDDIMKVAPKRLPQPPIEVTDEMLVDLYDHSAEDEWPAHLINGEAVRRIVQRAFKHVGLEVKV